VMAEVVLAPESLMVSKVSMITGEVKRGQTPHFEGVLDPQHSVR
jgi:hypothetical protein